MINQIAESTATERVAKMFELVMVKLPKYMQLVSFEEFMGLESQLASGVVDVVAKDQDRKGELVDMGMSVPEEKLTAAQITNRSILRLAMQSAGFVPDPNHWWRYCF